MVQITLGTSTVAVNTGLFWSNRYLLANRSRRCCQQISSLPPTDLVVAVNRSRHWLPTDFVTDQTSFCTVNSADNSTVHSAANSAVNAAVNPTVNSALTT
ncbi:hypothetical protein F511_25055 [Dorcoceras hygrometricum]|uniref:Uncharacterized protein n=1 Tax=Dorcoceras hygrometricum TaxID=472368 RepID=A0A2Z7CUH1_9LAMI|nr:hypothetical protein F511_25055 [Dorcoceras hygrometricum]